MKLFESKNNGRGVLRSETYLDTSHQPSEPVGRDSKINRIVDAVRPLNRRRKPENLLIHGPAGVGKTTCVKHVLNQLEDQTRVKTVYINCWQYNTRSSLLTELLIQLGYPAPRKGKPVDELLAKIREWINKNRGVAVALDEFDQLDEHNEVIYDLETMNTDSENQVGLLMVSNQQPETVELDPRSRSRLNCQTLQFKPYTAEKITQIPQDRVDQSFRPGTVPSDTTQKIAEIVADNSGDLRNALQLLLRAGRKADREGQKEVSIDMISHNSE